MSTRLLHASLAVLLGTGLNLAAPALPGEAQGPVHIVAREVSHPVHGEHVFSLPIAASHVAVHWSSQSNARLTISLSRDGAAFGPARPVETDEDGGEGGSDENYGAVVVAGGARFVKVGSDRAVSRVTVLALDTLDHSVTTARVLPGLGMSAAASVSQPAVITRAGWGADESLRFDSSGKEKWGRTFWPIKKLIVHHTATLNNDPNPAATVRAIYYYQAITQGWGDIGYNFLIDEKGRIYEGRYTRSYAPGEYPSEEDVATNGVTGAHARHFNAGTVGIALLGTFTAVAPTSAARGALKKLLAWKTDRQRIDPHGAGTYTNPADGTRKKFPNIAGHRAVAATACPGDKLYALLPAIRDAVATLIASPTTRPARPALTTDTSSGDGVTLSWSPPGDGGSPIIGYTIYRREEHGMLSPLATVGAVTSFGDTSGRQCGFYGYEIRAANAVGLGPPSDPAVALVPTPPSTPIPASNFTVTAAPSCALVKQGQSASYDVAISGTDLSTPVTLSVSGLPDGATAVFSPDPVTADSAILTVGTSNCKTPTPIGTSTLTVSGSTEDATSTVTVLLTVTNGPPTVRPPVSRTYAGTTLGSSTTPERTSWSACDADDTSSNALQRQVNGGSWTTVTLSSPDAKSISQSLAFGYIYRYRVRSWDSLGNGSAYAYGPSFVPRLAQQSSSAVSYGGTWHTAYATSYSGGSVKYATAAGAWARYTFTGSSVAWVAERGPTRGSARVYIDGVYRAAMSLYASTYQARKIVYAFNWGANGTHTIRIVAVGTPGRPRVDIDAFVRFTQV